MNQEFIGYLIPVMLIIAGLMMKNYEFLNVGIYKKYWWIPVVIGILNICLKIAIHLLRN